MLLHQLQPIHKPKQKKRVGRGGAHGFHCGKGGEGQKVRAGRRMKPIIRELIKKYPKLRGYRFKAKKETFTLLRFMLHISDFVSAIPDTQCNVALWNILQRNGSKSPRIKWLSSLCMFHNMRYNSTEKDINSY